MHDLCACTASHDFALTQCQWQCPWHERFLGLGLSRAFTLLTLLTHLPYCARSGAGLADATLPANTTADQPDEESNVCLRHYDLRPRGQEASLLIELQRTNSIRPALLSCRAHRLCKTKSQASMISLFEEPAG